MKMPAVRLYCVVAAMLAVASPALAQFQPITLEGPPIGERYRVEGFAGFWNPAADMRISSESLGIPGSTIDFKEDLALQDHRIGDLRVVLRAARKHKFRFQSVPIEYSEEGVTVTRDIVFNGQRYLVGVPVNWVADWRTYRLGYEYDFIVRDRGFGGFIADVKYTQVRATLATPFFSEFARARGPIPTIGGIARVYVVPSVSVTFEMTGIRLPESLIEGSKAHYADIDLYGVVNFNHYVGAQLGFRSVDVGYLFDEDYGNFDVRGLYFGIVARY